MKAVQPETMTRATPIPADTPTQPNTPSSRPPYGPTRAELVAQWEQEIGRPPPPYLSILFMSKALVYEAQCSRAAGLSGDTRRTLQQITRGTPTAAIPLSPGRVGTHYVREWNGRTYQVEAQAGGFEMDGRIWPSLSAIAKHITGTTWSGPRFFGPAKVKGKGVSR